MVKQRLKDLVIEFNYCEEKFENLQNIFSMISDLDVSGNFFVILFIDMSANSKEKKKILKKFKLKKKLQLYDYDLSGRTKKVDTKNY